MKVTEAAAVVVSIFALGLSCYAVYQTWDIRREDQQLNLVVTFEDLKISYELARQANLQNRQVAERGLNTSIPKFAADRTTIETTHKQWQANDELLQLLKEQLDRLNSLLQSENRDNNLLPIMLSTKSSIQAFTIVLKNSTKIEEDSLKRMDGAIGGLLDHLERASVLCRQGSEHDCKWVDETMSDLGLDTDCTVEGAEHKEAAPTP